MEPADVEGERVQQVEEEEEEDGARFRLEELRLVLIGKARSGKSTSGNTILGRKHFQAKCTTRPVTKVCMDGRADNVVVVDVPGFGDTNLDTEQCHLEVAKCVTLSAPGPHAFLLVVPIGSYTKDESRAVDQMVKIFGEEAVRNYTMILFTRGDDLEEGGIEEYLDDAVDGLKALIERCGGRYHVLNNKATGDRQQVRQLLGKVEAMVEGNGGGCYTNEMFLEVERLLREEQERLMRKELRVQGQVERGVLSPKQFRELAVRSPDLLERIKILVAAALAGVAVGAAFGALAPLAAAGGAALVGNAIASQLAATTVLSAGAAIGAGVGGSMGVMNGLEAANVQDGVIDTITQVGITGVAVAGEAFVGGVLLGAAGDIVDGSGSVQSTGATTSSGLVESTLDSASSGLGESTVDAASSGLVEYARDAVSSCLVESARNAVSSGLVESAGDAVSSGLVESAGNTVSSGLVESAGNTVSSGLVESAGNAVSSGLVESAGDAVSSGLVESAGNTVSSRLVESDLDAASSGLVESARDAVSSGLVESARDAVSSGLVESARDAVSRGLVESDLDAASSGLGEVVGVGAAGAALGALGKYALDAAAKHLSVTVKEEKEEFRSSTGAHSYSEKRYTEFSWNKKDEN